jgi:hypothetical protein
MRRARKALAASFVVTFVAGCDSKPTQPAAAPTVDVGPTPVPAAASASPADSNDAGSATDAGAEASSEIAQFPPAPPIGRVVRNPDGTCWWRPGRPRPVRPGAQPHILNPPPPRRVQCPPDDAGS